MRSYFENHLGYYASPVKVFYYGPMFRYERPQAGRYRQFHQWGFEIIGDADPFYDTEIILVCLDFLSNLGVKDMCLAINTVGCRVCRPNYRKKLLQFFKSRKKDLCADCERRYEKNPLRLLDCKEESCVAIKKQAPVILDCLCQNCNAHFKGVLELIEECGIDYTPDPYLVRGLDYYSRTVFEIFGQNDSQALAGGGRYDYLSEIIAQRVVPAVGGAFGIERVIEYLNNCSISVKAKKKPAVFFIAIGNQAKKSSAAIINKMRQAGIKTLESIGRQSLKAQLKMADKTSSVLALIYGQKESFEKSIIIRDMKSGVQETVLIDKVIDEIKRRLH
jgi:histidyl-tRNA synthetase